MKKYIFAVVIVVAALLAGIVAYENVSENTGVTVANREDILGEVCSGDWHIENELLLEGYIISSFYGNGQVGLAIFAPVGDKKYENISFSKTSESEIISLHYLINDHFYDFAWYNQETAIGKFEYKVEGKTIDSQLFDTSKKQIMYKMAEEKSYELEIHYYSESGEIIK